MSMPQMLSLTTFQRIKRCILIENNCFPCVIIKQLNPYQYLEFLILFPQAFYCFQDKPCSKTTNKKQRDFKSNLKLSWLSPSSHDFHMDLCCVGGYKGWITNRGAVKKWNRSGYLILSKAHFLFCKIEKAIPLPTELLWEGTEITYGKHIV